MERDSRPTELHFRKW